MADAYLTYDMKLVITDDQDGTTLETPFQLDIIDNPCSGSWSISQGVVSSWDQTYTQYSGSPLTIDLTGINYGTC